MMTADEGLALAQYVRPGRVIVVGGTAASDEQEPAADDQPIWRRNRLGIKPITAYPPEQQSWWARDFHLAHGWVPSLWAIAAAHGMSRAADRPLTTDEWEWLRLDSTGLADVHKWITDALKRKTPPE